MSEYMEKTLEMTELDCLLDALNDLGFGPDKVQVNEMAVNLTGYHGDKRVQKAHVVIPRRHVQQAANDIGFEKTAEENTNSMCPSSMLDTMGMGSMARSGRPN